MNGVTDNHEINTIRIFIEQYIRDVYSRVPFLREAMSLLWRYMSRQVCDPLNMQIGIIINFLILILQNQWPCDHFALGNTGLQGKNVQSSEC